MRISKANFSTFRTLGNAATIGGLVRRSAGLVQLVGLAGLTVVIALASVAIARPATAQTTTAAPADALTEALRLVQADAFDEAIVLLEGRRSDAGLDAPAQALLGALLLQAGRAGEAFAVLEPLAQRQDVPAAVLYNAWRAAAAVGNGREQIDLLARASDREPRSPASRELGLLHAAAGRDFDAYRLLGPWAQAHPDDGEARLIAAFSAIQLRRVPDAEALLSDLPQEEPRVRLLWANLLLLQADPYGALATLKALPDNLPPALDLDRRRLMAEGYFATGESDRAIPLLDGRVGQDPSLALQLARVQAQNGDLEASLGTAKPFADRVLADPQALPSNLAAAFLYEAGDRLTALNRPAEAVPFLRLSSQLEPDRKLTWRALGQSLAASGDREAATEALATFQKISAEDVRPDRKREQENRDAADPTGANVRRALKLLQSGRAGAALEVAAAELQLVPQDPRPRLAAAQALIALDREAEALSLVDEGLAASPADADLHYQRGIILMGLERPADAETELRAALEISPSHTPAMNDLAVLLMVRRDYGEARQLLQRILEINPEDPLAAANLQQLAVESG